MRLKGKRSRRKERSPGTLYSQDHSDVRKGTNRRHEIGASSPRSKPESKSHARRKTFVGNFAAPARKTEVAETGSRDGLHRRFLLSWAPDDYRSRRRARP